MSDDHDNAGLSEEELAALEGSDDETTTETDDDESAGADTGDAGGDNADTDGSGDAGDDAAADDDVAAADDDAAPPAGEAELNDPFLAQLAARGIPDDLDDQLSGIDTSLTDLDKKLADGDIEYTEHVAQNRELMRQQAELVALQRESEFVATQNAATSEQHWKWELSRFFEDNDNFNNAAMSGALEGTLKTLYEEDGAIEKGYRWLLNEAKSRVESVMGITPTAKDDNSAVGEAAAKAAEAAARAARGNADKSAAPKNLAGVPEAEASQPSDDPFAGLDKLSGMELEQRLSRMSKAEEDNYLNTRSIHS